MMMSLSVVVCGRCLHPRDGADSPFSTLWAKTDSQISSVDIAGFGAEDVGGSAVKHRPADVISQSLVVNYELANRIRELVTLPLALESSCGLALALPRCSTCGFDRIGGRTELVRGDVCDGAGLAGGVGGVP